MVIGQTLSDRAADCGHFLVLHKMPVSRNVILKLLQQVPYHGRELNDFDVLNGLILKLWKRCNSD